MSDNLPSTIGKFSITAKLGEGGFAIVYRGVDPIVNRPVAIKVLTDVAHVKLFLREVECVGNLHHKNIVTVYEFGNDDQGRPFLVMEVLAGTTLRGLITSQRHLRLSLIDKLGILIQIAEGLSYAHANDVIHRDIKPENIMLLPDGSVKIMDFGIARHPNAKTTQSTAAGFHTPGYAAPELYDQVTANEATDMYAYGITAFELLTGHKPFISEVRIADVHADASPDLENILAHAFALSHQTRYQRFSDILSALRPILVRLHRQHVKALVADIENDVKTRAHSEARRKIEELASLDPGNEEIDRLRAEVEAGERHAITLYSSILVDAIAVVRRWCASHRYSLSAFFIIGFLAAILFMNKERIFPSIDMPVRSVALNTPERQTEHSRDAGKERSMPGGSTHAPIDPGAKSTAARAPTNSAEAIPRHTEKAPPKNFEFVKQPLQPPRPLIASTGTPEFAVLMPTPLNTAAAHFPPFRTTEPQPRTGDRKSHPKDGQYYVWIAGTSGVPGFAIGLTETTLQAYRLRFPGKKIERTSFLTNPSAPDIPVIQLTFADARHFCEWLGGALPSPQQWQAAVKYAILQEANIEGRYEGGRILGTQRRTGELLRDLLGNVEEWGSDGRLRGGYFLSKASEAQDPKGRRGNTIGYAGCRCVLPSLAFAQDK